MRKIDRRKFTQEASLAFLAGVSVVVSACGGGTGGGGNDGYGPTGGTPTQPTPPAPTPAEGSESGQISDNHGHKAVITAAELLAGGALRLDIAGTAGHSHIVDLSPQMVQDIRGGSKVASESTTTEGHDHTVTFNADAAGDPGTGY